MGALPLSDTGMGVGMGKMVMVTVVLIVTVVVVVTMMVVGDDGGSGGGGVDAGGDVKLLDYFKLQIW